MGKIGEKETKELILYLRLKKNPKLLFKDSSKLFKQKQNKLFR
jgi:hypothetical protein